MGTNKGRASVNKVKSLKFQMPQGEFVELISI